ncbi:CMP-N-acetylneuraminate-beta-galactosamide-alpha-2,3-sialyltransferase 1-like isoform X2 [Chiloscyllium plagiosum]|uniref:CMP-N-acetylneuraminate-beta-galactosamide- alpha-2,3-sialyltransferase 1-like isoform X2 n=1 Tax=Chiloscyllium plagiosum TaxID=36176 RepID=UPI001CB883B1|nr:CMP-N-acetylneuraminate-beta-galactosamide-alpha-2,3-sialyltransferase 1-like isoform X2 [Chiloscyllium plagiosum]
MFAYRLQKHRWFFSLVIFAVLLLSVFFTYTDYTKFSLRNLLPVRKCKCNPCVSELNKSEWFDKRYIPTMYPILTKNNYTLPEATYKWWQRLQHERKESNYSSIMEEMFKLFPGDDKLMEQGPNRCRTCAVIGNSGNLKGSNYGPSIDSNNLVMRMNRARTVGYEADVGSKTTHHFMYPESARDLAENVSLVLIPFKILDIQWLISAFTTGNITRTYIPVMRHIKANKDKVLVYNPHFFKYVYDNWNEHHGRYSSTGMLVIIFALHVCDEVNVYGFGANSIGHWHHYWEKNAGAGAFRATGVHDGDFEANVTKTLADVDLAKFQPQEITDCIGPWRAGPPGGADSLWDPSTELQQQSDYSLISFSKA